MNGASIVVLTYFLYMRAKAGSTAVWHFFAAFERCLPAWWKQRRLEAERESVAQLVTSAIALSYVLQSLTLITGPAPFPSETACAIVGGLINYTGLLNIGFSGFLAPYMAHKLVVKHKHPENVAKILGSRITLISTISFVITVIIALATEWQPIGQAYGRAGCWCWTVRKSKLYGAFVLNRRVVLHVIDATLARWRGDAGPSPLDGARMAPDALVDFHTALHATRAAQLREALELLPRVEGVVEDDRVAYERVGGRSGVSFPQAS